MTNRERPSVRPSHVELDGARYVILRESEFDWLCRAANIEPAGALGEGAPPSGGFDFGLDRATLAEKLVRRRRATGLSQAELARRAGVRPETLNRIERGRTDPDFKTVRKLVVAMNAAASQHLRCEKPESSAKELCDADTK